MSMFFPLITELRHECKAHDRFIAHILDNKNPNDSNFYSDLINDIITNRPPVSQRLSQIITTVFSYTALPLSSELSKEHLEKLLQKSVKDFQIQSRKS